MAPKNRWLRSARGSGKELSVAAVAVTVHTWQKKPFCHNVESRVELFDKSGFRFVSHGDKGLKINLKSHCFANFIPQGVQLANALVVA